MHASTLALAKAYTMLKERDRLDKRALFLEMELLPTETGRQKASQWCTPDAPCYSLGAKTIWAAMSGQTGDVCEGCLDILSQVNSFLVDFHGWRTTKEGRFELWCAEAARKGQKIEELSVSPQLLALKPQDTPSPPPSEDSPEQISFG